MTPLLADLELTIRLGVQLKTPADGIPYMAIISLAMSRAGPQPGFLCYTIANGPGAI